ncbi:unnamed protein product [Pedinophyceae sp. YPF-701]|nr:unnamed protein product [Pedinophyceae sp. YPF-701]
MFELHGSTLPAPRGLGSRASGSGQPRARPRCPATDFRKRSDLLTLEKQLEMIEDRRAIRVADPGDVALTDTHEDRAAQDAFMRAGSTEANLLTAQMMKPDREQPSIASELAAYDAATVGTADVAVVGAGPAGLALAWKLAAEGLKVVVIGRDLAFTNNYGVWVEEFEALGLGDVIDNRWEECVCYFGEGKEVVIDRPYGRVGRNLLRSALLGKCRESGVTFLEGEVVDVEAEMGEGTGLVRTKRGQEVASRLVTLAAGAATGKFLKYEEGAPSVAAQTAYGIEAEVEGYGEAYRGHEGKMLFMDYRRHHTGVWPGCATKLVPGEHPNAGDGLWGAAGEDPSFLYAMPLSDGRVFLEETCLVAKPALPFADLKARLYRRLAALGVTVKKVHDEEWSYIPTGGSLPVGGQAVTAFGAAANLIHPATGYSLTRSMGEAQHFAEVVARKLRETPAGSPIEPVATAAWEELWSQERRRRMAFNVFGMELLTELDLDMTNKFFLAFFSLPRGQWTGFLSNSLTSGQLLLFALTMFALAGPEIKAALVSHLLTNSSARYMLRAYLPSEATEGTAAR